jgi:hypothetical protein
MRALVFLAVFCLAGVTAFPQAVLTVTPPPSTVCSIPLLRITPPDIDPLISKKLPQASDRTSQARVPAPPCDEPAAPPPNLAQSLGHQEDLIKAFQSAFRDQGLREKMERLERSLQKSSPRTKPPAENPEATPTPAP